MKNILFLFAAILLAMPYNTNAEPKHTASNIDEVTVYLQGATVKRTAAVNLDAGQNEIVFDALSNNIDISSIRLECSSKVTILAVNGSTDYLTKPEKSEILKKLMHRLDTSNDGLSRVRNVIESYKTEIELLKQNYKITPGNNDAYTDVLENAADFTQKRVKEIMDDLTRLDKIEQGYLSKISDLTSQINEINGKYSKQTGAVTVTLSSENYQKASFILTYYVKDAGWIPSYNMRAENTDSVISLDYDAEIQQNTGEDWMNVKLKLSTGNPSVNGIKPKLEVNRLDYGEEQRHYRTSNNIGSKDQLMLNNTAYSWKFGDGDDSSKWYYVNPNYPSIYTNLNQNILATTFDINLRYDILSGDQAKHVRIQQYTLPAKFTYSAVPKVSESAYLEANITGWNSYNLIPGEVNVFLQNSFVGKSFIDPGTTKDTLTVSFGMDKRINMRRVRIKEFTRNQFLGANRIQSFGYATSIRNVKDKPVTITVEDQIPISAQKDIVVELKPGSGANLFPDTGKLTWDVTLQPNEEKTIRFEYTVKYPKNKNIPNL